MLGVNRIRINDTIENCGFHSEPLMLLYHFNFGFPMLDEYTKLLIPEGIVRARDGDSEKGMAGLHQFSKPVHDFAEQVFYHDFLSKGDEISVRLFNANICEKGLGVCLNYNKKQLPYFIE